MNTKIFTTVEEVLKLFLKGKLKGQNFLNHQVGAVFYFDGLDKNKRIAFFGKYIILLTTINDELEKDYKGILSHKELRECESYLLHLIVDQFDNSPPHTASEITTKFTQYISNKIQSYEIIIPLHGLHLEKTITLGDVTIFNTNDFPWKGNSIYSKEEIIARHTQAGDVCLAMINGACSKEMIFENAYEKLFSVLSILTFFADELGGTMRGLVYIDICGREEQGQLSFYTPNGMTMKLIGVDSTDYFAITAQRSSDFLLSPQGEKVLQALNNPSEYSFHKRFLLSLRWYRKAILASEREIRLILFFIALETLFTPTYKDQTGYTWTEIDDHNKRCMSNILKEISSGFDSHLQSAYSRFGKKIQNFRGNSNNLKDQRNSVTHEGSEDISKDDCSEMKMLYEAILEAILKDDKYWYQEMPLPTRKSQSLMKRLLGIIAAKIKKLSNFF